MLANGTTPVSMAAFVFQQTPVLCVNAAIWSTRVLIAKEVYNSLNQTIYSAKVFVILVFFSGEEMVYRSRSGVKGWLI